MLDLKKLQKAMLKDVLTKNTQAPYLDHGDRITAYGNGYYKRFHEVLGNYYNLLAWIIGDNTFEALASKYILERPPAESNINLYGDDFPDFLIEKNVTPLWIEIAQTQKTVHHAHLQKQKPVFDLESAQDIDPPKWADAKFTFQPSMYLFTTDHPIHQVYNAYSQNNESIPTIEPKKMFYATYRQENHIYFEGFDRGSFSLLNLLKAQETLASALDKMDEEGSPEKLFEYFHKWQTYGLITDIAFS